MKNQAIKIIAVALLGLVMFDGLGRSSRGGQADQKSCDEWIYMRHADLYSYLIKAADVDEKEKALFRTKAYEEYFEYWVLTRSDTASCPRVPKFEEYFSRLVKNHVIGAVSSDDPLSIGAMYQDGTFKDIKMLPQVEGLDKQSLLKWSDYQKLVAKFKSDFNL